MRILLIGKFPPIEGGVSVKTFEFCLDALQRGHEVHFLTNSNEVENEYRQQFLNHDTTFMDSLLSGAAFHLYQTTPLDGYSQIPRSDCFFSKLFGIGSSILEHEDIDIIIGWYFEPYGLVASVLASLYSKPFILIHAGSDLGRLSRHPDLHHAYNWMVNNSTSFLTKPRSRELLVSTFPQISNTKKLRNRPGVPLPKYFTEKAPKLDINEYVDNADELFSGINDDELKRSLLSLNQKRFHPIGLTLGMYGKVGRRKGTFALLESLSTLASDGVEFSFIGLFGGKESILKEAIEIIEGNVMLAKRTWILPFVPPWRIPSYLNLCDITCFLENRFPISIHGPGIPFEVLTFGSCLVCSKEIADKSFIRANLIDRKTFVEITDPEDTEELPRRLNELLSNEHLVRSIAARGNRIAHHFNQELRKSPSLCEILEDLV